MTDMEFPDLIGLPEGSTRGKTMSVSSIVNNILKDSIHTTRIHSLSPLIESIISTKRTRLTLVGRDLSRHLGTQERSCIRRVDRCLANRYYQTHVIDIYTSISHWLLRNNTRPIIVVDWSSIPNSNRRFEHGEHTLLRASLVASGRGLALYEELYEKKYENNPKVHQQFLKKLRQVIPKACKPIIVTDAGFKNPWFKAVLSLGWDYVGRVRGLTCIHDGNSYMPVKTWFEKVKSKAAYLGYFTVAKTNPLETHCYSYKHRLKRQKKYGKTKRDQVTKKASQGYREPWIITSSLNMSDMPAKVIQIYKHRMTIEENFRDTKSQQFGFGLRENVTHCPERIVVWLMLVAISALVAYYVGYLIEKLGKQREFQANSYKHRRVLSLVFIGCQAVRSYKIPIIQVPPQDMGVYL